ncbi:MAG TPA: DUF1439 domain-containing protein, partial [Ramlibacter sp.]
MAHRPQRFLPSSRRLFLLRAGAAALPLGLPLAAHAGFNFFLSEYTASREELQVEITKRFPLTQRYAEVFIVSLLDPVLALDATANRASLTARLSISSPFLQPSTVGGVVAMSSA